MPPKSRVRDPLERGSFLIIHLKFIVFINTFWKVGSISAYLPPEANNGTNLNESAAAHNP